MRRVTVHDVAAQAGVSLASVDRVLNDRGGVSEAMRSRVRATIERLGFQRDHYAASLATSRQYRFAFVLPRRERNTFLDTLRAEIHEQARRLSSRRVSLTIVDYAAFDAGSLARALEGLLREPKLDAVALIGVDATSVRSAIDALSEEGIPVVTLISDVSPSARRCCISIDNVAAGRTAASLIGRFNAARTGKIAVIAGSMALRDHSERALGFMQVMQQDWARFELMPPREGLDDGRLTYGIVRTLLDSPDLIGIYSLGAGNRGVIEAVEQSGRQGDIVVVAHELTLHARRALLSGTFDAVLHQSATDEVAAAIATLRALSDGAASHDPARIRIEIFLRDNLP